MFNFKKKTSEEWARKGEDFRLAKDYDNALTCFNKALKTNPAMHSSKFAKGLVLGMKGQQQEALNLIMEAARAGNEKAKAFLAKGGA